MKIDYRTVGYVNSFNKERLVFEGGTNTGSDGGADNGGADAGDGDNGGADDNTNGNSTDEATDVTFESGDEVEIDGVSLTINENGDAVDSDGKVIATKSQIKEMSTESNSEENNEGNEDTFTIDDVAKITGVEVVKDGKKLVFDNTPEGFAKRELAIIANTKEATAQSAISEFFKENPAIYAAYKYKTVNGSLKGFGVDKQYANLSLDTMSVDQKINIIKADLKGQNISDSRINSLVKSIVDSDTVDAEAKASLALLKENEAKSDSSLDESYKAKLAATAKEIKAFNKTVKSTINAGKVKGFNIPESMIKVDAEGNKVTVTRDEFEDYMTKPVFKDKATNVTYTAFQVDYFKRNSNRTPEDDVVSGLSLFLGSDDLMDTLREAKVRKKITLRKRRRVDGGFSGRLTGRVKDEDIILN